MKISTRVTAMLLTVLLVGQLPFTVFANTAQQTQIEGQVTIVDENGEEQVVTAEQLASGQALPENIVVNSEAGQEAQSDTVQNGVDTSINDTFSGVVENEESVSNAQDVAIATSESAASTESVSAASESVGTTSGSSQADSELARIDIDLPLVTTTQAESERVDMNLPLVQATDQVDQRMDETVSLNEEEMPEQEAPEELLPYIYWNPGQGYEVDSVYLETPKAESENMSESTLETTSESESAASSAAESAPAASSAAESVPAASSAAESAPAASSAAESAPAASSAAESVPAASSAAESAPAASSAAESVPVASSVVESVAAASSVAESAPAASSAAESAPAASSAAESVPVASSVAESVAAASSVAESAPVESTTVTTEPAPQTQHETAQPAGALEQAGQVLDSLNPVQTAHAADSLEPQNEQGFFESIMSWVAWLFSPLTQFFKDFVAFGLSANEVPEGDDGNTGRSPLAPVKTFDGAMQRAQELATELGIGIDQVTIYMMNPLEVVHGQAVEISSDMAVLKAWEGRNYDSDVLFYLAGGTLGVTNAVLAPREVDPANLQDSNQSLVWIYGGSLELGNNVSVYGGFVLDFYQQETAHSWNLTATLSAEKSEVPVIRLRENFEPTEMGYAIQLKESDQTMEQLELVQAPYVSQAQMQEYAQSFQVTGDTASEWEYKVLAQQEQQPQAAMARMAVQDSTKSSGSASLYAVRAEGDVIYWNPGGELTINETVYPEGDDDAVRSGLTPWSPLKTLKAAIEMAKKGTTNRIVCMRTLEINQNTADDMIAQGYLAYDEASKTFQLHGELFGGNPIILSNWDQGLPIVNLADGYNLSMENITLQGYTTETTDRAGNLVTVGLGCTLTMNENASVIGNSYIQLVFNATDFIAPNPIMVNSQKGVGATIYASGINFAPHFIGTTLVRATDALLASDFNNNKDAAGAALAEKFFLSSANTTPSTEGTHNQIAWRLEQSVTLNNEHSLVLMNSSSYSAIYLDPVRGKDIYEGTTCEFPVKTLERAMELLAENIPGVVEDRKQAFLAGKDREYIDATYPLPQNILVCSPIEINTEETWDWSSYQWYDYDNTEIHPVLIAHEDPPNNEQGGTLHEQPQYVVRVVEGGKLTLGADVRIGRLMKESYGFDSNTSLLKMNVINVTNGGTLILTSTAEIFGESDIAEDLSQDAVLYKTYPGTGIIAGVESAFLWTRNISKVSTTTQATVLLDAGWMGSIHGLSRGVLLCGEGVTMTMDAGTICENKSNYTGAGVSLFQSAQFVMNGGTIRNNYAAAAAGALVDGYRYGSSKTVTKFTMNAGTITENTIDRYTPGSSASDMGGAGVQTYYGEFEMGTVGGDNNACVISNNRLTRRKNVSENSTYGIGVSIVQNQTSVSGAPSFVMHSGKIIDNVMEDEQDYGRLRSLVVNGIGVGTSNATHILVENGEISGNKLKSVYNTGYYGPTFAGLGMYIGSAKQVDITLRNLTIKNNSVSDDHGTVKCDKLYGYGGGLSFNYGLSSSTSSSVLLENVQVVDNLFEDIPGITTTYYGGGIDLINTNNDYNSDVARLINVTVSRNRATYGGGIFGGFYWAKNLTVTDNAATLHGGGWATGLADDRAIGDVLVRQVTLLEDVTFTGNTAGGYGGAIYLNSVYKDNYVYTITESAPGKTIIQNNTAADYGAGVYVKLNDYATHCYFDFTAEWNNTVTNQNQANPRGKNLYITDFCNGSVYLLKGTFTGTNEICAMTKSGAYSGALYLDPSKVNFTTQQTDESTIYLDHVNTTVYLLEPGSSANPLNFTINPDNFNAGNAVFKPADLDTMKVNGLSADANQQGGYAVVQKSYAYSKLTDASKSSIEGEIYSDYITVSGTPIRTQLGAMSDTTDASLINLALIGEGVYLDGTQGSDTNNGLSPKQAVRTWDKAVQLLQTYSAAPPNDTQQETGFQPIIWVSGTVTLEKDELVEQTVLTLPQSMVSAQYKTCEEQNNRTPERAVVRRFGSNNQPLFVVEDGAVVSLQNLRVDGNSVALTNGTEDTVSFSVKPGGTLKVGDGARLYESFSYNVYMAGGTLEVDQSYPSTEVDAENDEKYGLQISSTSTVSAADHGAVYLAGDNCTVLLKGNAYVGSTSRTAGGDHYVFRVAGDYASLTMQDNSILRGADGIYRQYRKNMTLHLKDYALMDNASHAIYSTSDDSNTGLFECKMEGNSRVEVSTSSTKYFWYENSYQTSSRFEFYDSCKVTGTWLLKGIGQSVNVDLKGSMTIVMGHSGGTDTPVIDMGTSTLVVPGGQLYLEMNAQSQLLGQVQFSGLSEASSTDLAKTDIFGIIMRDSAKIEAKSSKYAVLLYFYCGYTGATGSGNNRWNANAPFTITLEENSSIGCYNDKQTEFTPIRLTQEIDSYVSDEDMKQYFIMGADQKIILRGNAKLQDVGYFGAIYHETDYTSSIGTSAENFIPAAEVVFEDNAGVEFTNAALNHVSYTGYPLITARKVTLRDNVSLPDTGNAAADSSAYGQGISLKVWEMELEGTTSVAGSIWLLGKTVADGTIGKITLTQPIASTADQGRYKLHLAANCMGQIVVAPGGNVTDASIYLDCFTKLAGEGGASSLDLKEQGLNIILDREWNVYLSTNGNDQNDGSTPEKAVRTFKRAKELLTTVEGYGEGSNIIIPDNLTIQNHDKTWSFEEGGALTNVNGDKWKPSVCRMQGTIYTKPLITVNSGAYSTDAANGASIAQEEADAPVVFENITIDDGGSGAIFNLQGTGESEYNFSMLYINTGSISKGVELGQNAVLCNLDYDMLNSGIPGVNDTSWSWRIGGLALNVLSGNVVIDGAVIENFSAKNFYVCHWSGYVSHAAIITVHSSNSSLEMREGVIRNNTMGVRENSTTTNDTSNAILTVSSGAKFSMLGGEISGNTVQATTGHLNGAAGIVALTGSNSTMTLAGGKITGNTNRLGIDTASASANNIALEGIIGIGTKKTSLQGCTLTMSGGSIMNNTARHGSAFALINGTVTLSGGTIRGNQSVKPIPTTGEPTGWLAQYCPIYVDNTCTTRLNLQGSGCVADDPFYLAPGRQIIVTDQLRQTNRLYEIYTGTGSTPAANLVVIPDGQKVEDVTPYLHNFHAHAKGMVLDRGRENKDVTTQLGLKNEQTCLVQMKAVFVDGNAGVDPESIDLSVPQDTLGRSPSSPVQTFDAAKATGEALCFSGEDPTEHAKHKNHYVIYVMGTVYNDLYTGTVTDATGTYTKNEDENNFVFSLEGAAYMCRYTSWGLCMGNGLHQNGIYCYDSLVKIRANSGTATMSSFILRGRREVDSTDNNGETLIVVENGSKLVLSDKVTLERNNVSGSRPSPEGGQMAINTKGGAVRVEAGAEMVMQGGIIDTTCTAITGSSVYLTGSENGLPAANLTLNNSVDIGGEVYLGGQQGQDALIFVDSSFVPKQPISVGIQNDYNQKVVVQWTDGTEVTEKMLGLFSFATSVTALYEVLPGITDSAVKNNSIILNLRNILYLDPDHGSDENSGETPDKPVRTIGRIYDMFKNAGSIPGVLVFVMNPIKIPDGRLLAVTNGSVQQDGNVQKYISVYYEGVEDTEFDTTVGIHHAAEEKVIESQIYFKRYVKTSDENASAAYSADSNLKELFIVQGQLQLNGVYLDGHSNKTESNRPGQSTEGVAANAPLVRVDATGSAQFLTGELTSHQYDGKNYQVGNTLLTNNINNNVKTNVLPGTDGLKEGSSAGIEILSQNTDLGYEAELRGKMVLFNTQFVNLQLGQTTDGETVIGGSDIYQNGELVISNNVYFEGTVFLEGNGRNGQTAEAISSRETSRFIEVNAYGSPVSDSFDLLVRDSYHNRRMIKYPYSTTNIIPQSEIGYYMLGADVSGNFVLINELVAPSPGGGAFDEGENTLWLRIPQAVYIDPDNGDDQHDGQYPETAVATLEAAFQRMSEMSSQVLYVINTISITGSSYIDPTGYVYNGTAVQMPNNSVHVEIRRYVQPDNEGNSTEYYKIPSFTDGPLFRVEERGELVLAGNVTVNGHSEPFLEEDIPDGQKVSNGAVVTAPLIEVMTGGILDLRDDQMTGGRVSLINNNNTGTLADGQTRIDGGAINNKGSVIVNGGALRNNKAAPIASPGTTAMGSADGVYQAGDMTISAYPQGLEGQSIYLASDVSKNAADQVNFIGDHILTMDMRLESELDSAGEKLVYSLDMDNAVVGRQVVSYPGDSGVDPEYASYHLGTTVEDGLFLVESQDISSNLELQDWKYLNVSVPEEVFLAVYEYHNRDENAPYDSGVYTELGRADVSGGQYATPEYTITNNGLYGAKVSVTGFVQVAWQDGKDSMQLAATTSELSSTDPLLYIALTNASQTQEEGNNFAAMQETPLKGDGSKVSLEMGVLQPEEYGSFAFTAAANEAFMDLWMDAGFPASSLATAQERIDYMRSEDVLGDTSLNQAAAQFKLTYRIDIDPLRS